MAFELAALSIGQLQNLIENHQTKGATNVQIYTYALQELETRGGKGLDFHKSVSIISQAAKEGRFLSYKELADASGADWNQVHYAMNKHLWKLVEYSHLVYKVIFSSIVVKKANVNCGRMEPETLKGFIAAARFLDYTVTDEIAFLKDQQSRVFTWAKGELTSGV